MSSFRVFTSSLVSYQELETQGLTFMIVEADHINNTVVNLNLAYWPVSHLLSCKLCTYTKTFFGLLYVKTLRFRVIEAFS